MNYRLGIQTKGQLLNRNILLTFDNHKICTVNSQFKKDLKLQVHLHKAFFSEDLFLDSLHKSFLNQTTLDLTKEKWTFLNREFTVLEKFRSHLV